MAAAPVISILSTKTALNALTALLSVGGAGTIEVRTGAPEATTLTADSGTLLATLTLSATAFAAATNATANGLATATANAITSATAVANGTAGHWRAKSNAGVVIVQGNAATSGADMILSSTTINSGDTVSATSWKITLPCGDGAS